MICGGIDHYDHDEDNDHYDHEEDEDDCDDDEDEKIT